MRYFVLFAVILAACGAPVQSDDVVTVDPDVQVPATDGGRGRIEDAQTSEDVASTDAGSTAHDAVADCPILACATGSHVCDLSGILGCCTDPPADAGAPDVQVACPTGSYPWHGQCDPACPPDVSPGMLCYLVANGGLASCQNTWTPDGLSGALCVLICPTGFVPCGTPSEACCPN